MKLLPFAFAFTLLASAALANAELVAAKPENLSLRNEVDLAISKGVASLQKAQNADGSWSLSEQPALTALPLTALMLQPSQDYRKKKPEFVKKGYDFLISSVQSDGGIYRKGLANYNTSLSLVALVAANDPTFTPVIRQARKFVIGQQAHGLTNPAFDGGMGYGPNGTSNQLPDLSNTVMALEALHASKTAAGEKTAGDKDLNWSAAVEFIQRCQNLPSSNKEDWASDDPANKGGFIYSPGNSKAGETTLPNGKKALRSYGSISYAGLLSYLYADLKKSDPRVTAVVEWLTKNYTLDENPGMGPQGLYYYYYMMAKALNACGITELELKDGRKVDWRKDLALKLINLQKADGSWNNDNGRWMEKDPVLVTSYSVLTLELIHGAL